MKNVEYIVYKITNKLNGKVYIGQTTEGIEKRWKRHCGYQINDGTYFHNAIKKYGAENFTIEIIDKAKNQEELNELEFFYINKYNNNCYNTKFENNKCGYVSNSCGGSRSLVFRGISQKESQIS